MKTILIILIIFICSGCSSSTPNTDMAINVANRTISVMKSQVKSLDVNLPKENFEIIKQSLVKQIDSFPETLELIKSNCKKDVKNQVRKTRKWQLAFFSLLMLIVGFILIKRRVIL